jgi:hypothetical protein
MKTIVQIFTIMLVSSGFFWGGFPAGLAFKFPLFVTAAITAAGAELAVILVLVFGSPLQAFLKRKFPMWMEKTQKGKVGEVWQKYGMPGLGLISPVVPGAPQSVVIALALGAKPSRVLLWVSIGILMWTLAVVAGLSLGIGLATQIIK